MKNRKHFLSLLAASLIWLPAMSQGALSTREIGSIPRGYANDADCFGNLLFQFHSQNSKPSGDFHGVTIMDLKTGSPLQFIYLGFNQNYHNSSINFSTRKFAPGDRFPLLYASENYAPNNFYKILVYRVRDLSVAYSLDVVQTLVMPSPVALGILYPHAFLDEDGEHIWIEAYSADQTETVFFKFVLPDFVDGTTMPLGRPLLTFRIPRKQVTDQAICMHGGKFWQVVGLPHEAWLRIINPLSGTVERDINLVEEGLAYEPEGVFFWKGKLCVSFEAGGKTRVFELALKKDKSRDKKTGASANSLIGKPLPQWKPGELDIHAVNAGRGESMFYIFPDGTTMVCDAGAAIVKNHPIPGTDPKPNAAISAGRVIADYIKYFLPQQSGGKVDYFLLSHYHGDHMGEYKESYPLNEEGNFRMNGITELGVLVPFRKIIDRGDPAVFVSDCTREGNSPGLINYRKYISWSERTHGTVYEPFEPGILDQISLVHADYAVPAPFSIRNIASSGYVWTGSGTENATRIPSKEEQMAPGGIMAPENIMSCCIHLEYGKFDWFSGGDIQYTGMTQTPWKDIETPIAKVMPQVEGMKACHHGTRNANGENLLRALCPDIFVVNAWRDIHPYDATVVRLLGINPNCEIYSTNVTAANYERLWNSLSNFGATQGHIVVRVAPGGEEYTVYVLDDSDQRYIVKSVSRVHKCR
ncbi:MAG: hypothetical protein IJ686_00665 [Bacteroidales bacterium]|nr:hypothetical protein [Bacteroidales bacterium]